MILFIIYLNKRIVFCHDSFKLNRLEELWASKI